MVNQGLNSQKKAILWVDDEEYILASVRRLLRTSDFELVTEVNPEKALVLLDQTSFSIIVSDQRMPQMTGIELLYQAKIKSPHTTRIMVTGFIDQELLSEALNRAGVFRFINKPWADAALLNDLNKAFEHSEKTHQREQLRKQITRQNQALSKLNEGLEVVVSERTRSLEESRNELRSQENRVKDVIQFIERLNGSETVQDVVLLIEQELKSILSSLGSVSLLVSLNHTHAQMYFSQGRKVIKKLLENSGPAPLEARSGDFQDQSFLVNQLGRPVSKVLALPLQRYETDEPKYRTTVFVEYFCESAELALKMETIIERMQPVGIAIDRVYLSEALNKSARQWEKTFDNIDEPIAIIDKSYNLLRSNKPFSKIKTREACHEIFAGSKEPCSGCPLSESMMSGRSMKSTIKIKGRTYEVQSFPLHSGQEPAPTTAINYYSDVTEAQKLYGQLVQSEKMAALGELAGNIAHEINNPLTGIQSLTQILISKIDNADLKNDLSEIQMAAIRSQNIIKNFQEFSSNSGVQKKEWLALNEIVQKTLPLLKTVTRDLECHVKLDANNPKILANQHLIQQVFFNLVTNAAHAMPQGGKLEVTVFGSEQSVGFTVKDSGHGIPVNMQESIFEPFFTTKAEGIGTGLGLSVCRSVVREFGGDIILKSTVGVGSEFRIEFPKGKYGAKSTNS